MNRRLLLGLVLLLLTACRLTIAPPAAPAPETTAASACTRRTPDVHVLLNGLHGYCVHYPSAYDVAFINEFQVAFTRGDPSNMGAPRAEIVISHAEGRTVQAVAADWAGRYADGGIVLERSPTVIDGVAAVVLDNPQGAALRRHVFLVQQERLYMFTFTPAERTLGAPYQQMVELYTTMLDSFHLIP